MIPTGQTAGTPIQLLLESVLTLTVIGIQPPKGGGRRWLVSDVCQDQSDVTPGTAGARMSHVETNGIGAALRNHEAPATVGEAMADPLRLPWLLIHHRAFIDTQQGRQGADLRAVEASDLLLENLRD